MKHKKVFIALFSILILVIIVLVIFVSSGYKIYVKNPYSKTIDINTTLTQKEIFQRDFEFIYTEIRDSYVNLPYKEDLYGFDWDELYNLHSKELETIFTEKDFYVLCRKFITNLHDGHLSFGLYEKTLGSEIIPYIDDIAYALNIRIIEKKPIIFYSEFGDEFLGCELVTINEIPFMDILDKMIDYHYEGASDDFGAKSALLENCKFYNYFSYFCNEVPDVLTYELKDSQGNIRFISIDTLNAPFEDPVQSPIYFGVDSSQAISYKIIDNVGYIKIPSFDSNYSNVESDFENAVKELKNADVAGVVIDLRYNGGGDESFRKILGYLTNQDIVIENFHYRKSPRFDEFYGLRPFTDNIRNTANNDLSTQEGYTQWWSWIVTPAKEQFLTHVPVAVLTNECTFSSTDTFVNACFEYDLATVVGNSETLSGFGLPAALVAPSGKYLIVVGFQENVDIYGKPVENITVEPDVFAEQTISDFNNDIDTVLQVGINVINDQVDE